MSEEQARYNTPPMPRFKPGDDAWCIARDTVKVLEVRGIDWNTENLWYYLYPGSVTKQHHEVFASKEELIENL